MTVAVQAAGNSINLTGPGAAGKDLMQLSLDARPFVAIAVVLVALALLALAAVPL